MVLDNLTAHRSGAMYQFDDEYVTALRRRDPKAWEHYDAYFQPLLCVKFRAKFRWDVAQDLIQDVRCALLQQLDKGEPRECAKFGAYVLGIARNITLNQWRVIYGIQESDVDIMLLPDRSRSAERQAIGDEEALRVRAVLKTLSERNREVLTDLFFHGMSRDEASRKHGISKDQLRMILFHALAQFRKRWKR